MQASSQTGSSSAASAKSIDEIFTQLEELLIRERAAIQRVDAEKVASATAEKEALFDELVGSGIEIRPDLAPRLRNIIGELRRNVVLLAHGRDCLRDAIFAIQGEVVHDEGSPARPKNTRRRTRISVTG